MKTKRLLCSGVLALWLPAVLAADITVLELDYLSGAEALEIVQPFLDDTSAVSAHGRALIVQADPERIAALKAILAAVDRAPQPLRITVRYQAADRPAPGAADEQRLIAETRPRQRDVLTQTLQAVDGRWAEITASETHPLLEQTLAIGPRGGALLDERVQLLDLTSGFRVLPRRQGDSVTLDIAVRHDAGPSPETNAGTRLLTVLHARIGAWTELGGTVSGDPPAAGLHLSTRPSGPQLTRVFLRVDDL